MIQETVHGIHLPLTSFGCLPIRTKIVPETCTHLAFIKRTIWPYNGAGERFGQINMKRGHVAK